ncbi:MAG TPA: hypothetical protein V6D26_21785 [Stenomitos sp.]
MTRIKQRYEPLLISNIETISPQKNDFLVGLAPEKSARLSAKFEAGKKYKKAHPFRELQVIKESLKIRKIQIVDSIKIECKFDSEDKELNITFIRLQSLLEGEEDEDDYGAAKPSVYAYGTALALVSEAARLMSNRFARASASTDEKGGIRLTWTRPEAEVRLVCAHQSDKPTYIYHETGDEYGVERDVSASTLARWLDWLNNI